MATPDEQPTDSSPVATAKRLIGDITASERGQEKFLVRSRKIQKRYKQEQQVRTRRYALLYSNTQTILPAIYARPPEPVVSRRFKDSDPVGRAASEVLERALAYSIDKQDMDQALGACALDYALIARAVTWERYCPTYGPASPPQGAAVQVTNDAEPKEGEEEGGETPLQVTYEESVTDYVNQEDFGFAPAGARTWDEVTMVWRRVHMGRTALVERFGDKVGKAVPLDWKPADKGDREPDDLRCKAAVYECWDKSTLTAYWISKGYSDGPLDEKPDPLGLDGFFPCPRPMFGTLANDGLSPTADFLYYQDQADEVDGLTEKIASLEASLKMVGFYASDGKINLDNLMKATTGTMVPVASWQTLKEGGGVRGNIEWWPIEQVAATLKSCIELRTQLIEDVYQITGIADILRGSSDPNETAKAQGIKAQWGSLRIRNRQKEVMRFARDVLRIKAEVIAEQFSIETLKAMTEVKLPMAAEKAQAELLVQQAKLVAQTANQPGAPPQPPQIPPEVEDILSKPSWEDVKELLENNAARQFRIDIETDSTIEPDEMAEKQAAVEMTTAVGQFIQQWGPAIQAQPALAELAGELLKFTVRRFRVGRELEDVIDRTLSNLKPAPQAGEAPPDRTPVEVASIEQQTEQIKQQGEGERARIAAEVKMAELPLKQTDQQLKAIALTRDPEPAASA
jgi:hypothetical protein